MWSLSYSRGSGSVLATGGADRTVRLFSCPRGESLIEQVNAELAPGEEAVAEYNAKAAAGSLAGAGGTCQLPGAGTSSSRGRGGAAAAAAAAAAGSAAGVPTAAAAAAAAAGGDRAHGHGHAAPSWTPYQLLQTWTTQCMPVVCVQFSPRNLLLAGGPWTLQPKVISSAQHAAAQRK